ncbi:toll/interleukin-1 receptor domain-containing protein [Rhizobium sp. P32RR-XVIII]|uniref:toll/interleukin-1 receptor domain-containing protein n=1 Tax=Rhizobium sp. P32RR-XVIII TaxID=2726738 RepID=UPI0014575475|nr:toll/interleukin-1 receptor domain-containing protein [Rhizobium sp. P32RR-XVIII]NLS04989.1 toll/interleukin-1 receptor domain-containing protein [Rhizobium sp. P32RR-XVIII]
MANASHFKWLREGAESWNARREKRHFTPSLKYADLNGFDLTRYNLRGAQLGSASLRGANLYATNLTGADLTLADLTGAHLNYVQANSATFRRSNLNTAIMVDGDFTNVIFDGANLTDADLKHSFLWSTTWKNARLRGTILSSSLNGKPIALSLEISTGLTQRQISEAVGDTAVKLPTGLFHPVEWPEFINPEEEVEKDKFKEVAALSSDKFVFLSYSNLDRDVAKKLGETLRSAGISVWWDQDIQPGEEWRDAIAEKLGTADAVLAVWTEKSVASRAVREEAAQAQQSRKLLQVRMDRTVIPYGFSETQYVDLAGWGGDSSDHRIQRLIQAILDKFHPPSRDQIAKRLEASAPVAATLVDGVVTARDTPLSARPPVNDPQDLKDRIQAQAVLANKVLAALESLDNNIGESIRFDLQHYVSQLQSDSRTWYTLSDSISDIAVHLSNADIPWPGTTKNSISRLCRGHEGLRPLMQPVQPLPMSPDAPKPPPEVVSENLGDMALKQVVALANETFASEEAKSVLATPTIHTGEYLAVEIDQARTLDSPDEMAAHRRLSKLQKALVGLAGLVGTAVSTITYGISVNLLTAPDAAKVLLATMRRLFELVVSFF